MSAIPDWYYWAAVFACGLIAGLGLAVVIAFVVDPPYTLPWHRPPRCHPSKLVGDLFPPPPGYTPEHWRKALAEMKWSDGNADR